MGDSLVVGPYSSRLTGHTLEINLFAGAGKICSLNCVFCTLGETAVRLNQVRREIRFQARDVLLAELRRSLQDTVGLETVLLAGSGEPTLHPDFVALADECISLVREITPQAKTWISTNAAHIETRKMADAINRFDERLVRLDVGSERVFKQLASPLARVTLDRVVKGARSLKDTYVTATFFSGAVANTGSGELDEWFELLGMIRPKGIILRTLRRPHDLIEVVSEDHLDSLAARIERRLSLRPLVLA